MENNFYVFFSTVMEGGGGTLWLHENLEHFQAMFRKSKQVAECFKLSNAAFQLNGYSADTVPAEV